MIHNNLGEDTSSLEFVSDGIPITFNVLNQGLGFVNPTIAFTVSGTASSLFNSLASGLETVNVTVDSQTLQQQFKMGTVDLLVRNYEWYPNRDNNYSFAEAPPYVSYVMNLGPDTATNIIVKYSIGTGLIYQGYSIILAGIDNVTYDGQNLTYTINNLPANGIAAILIYLQVNATGTQTPQLTTTASLISVDQNENGPNTNTETQKLTIPNAADIQVTQDPINYNSVDNTAVITIHVKNNGPDDASGVQITDNLPSGLTYTGHTTGMNYSSGIWDIGTLNNGDSETLQIYANVIPTTGTLINTATKTGPTTLYDWNYANNAQTENLTLTGIYTPTMDLLVRNYEWYPNRDNNYSFAEAPPYVSYVMNLGPDTATNIIVKYTIGTGLIYQGYSIILAGIDNVTYDGQNLTYTINNLPANGIAAILIYLQVNATGTQTPQLTTTASLISVDQNENGPNPNTETQKLTIPNAADIQVQQNINGTTGITTNNNNDITLTLTVKNNGPNTCNNITITDTLNGLTYENNDQTATYNPNTQTLTWNINTLNPGDTTTLHITIKAENNGTYTTTANKTTPDTPYDYNYTNNTQTDYITRTTI